MVFILKTIILEKEILKIETKICLLYNFLYFKFSEKLKKYKEIKYYVYPRLSKKNFWVDPSPTQSYFGLIVDIRPIVKG